MWNVSDYVQSSSAGLSLDEVLQEPISALLGVNSRAAAALLRIGVETVFDLGSSWLFANASAALEASSGRFDVSSSDILQGDALIDGPDGAGGLPIESLRGLALEDAGAITTALELTTIRELALWPPRAIAQRLVRSATGGTRDDIEEEQTEALRPRLGEYPTERVYYDTLVMLGMGESPDRRPLAGPISLQPVVDDAAGFGQPAVGALVTFSQSWYAKGITLGHMLHSLALAPGEATRIAVVDWSRRTRAATSESIDEAERLDSATEHSRAISEVQNAVAEEMQSGGSMSSGWAKSKSKGSGGGFSVGGGIAGAFKGVTGVLGFGAGTASSRQEAESWTEASSSSWSVGNRSVMAEMAQRVNDRTEQHSTSVRNRRASAVREVAQSEHEEVSTRIVANYNHMHALTVQYYEVVQIYRVLAQVHTVQRVLFLPFELLDFTRPRAEDVVARFRAQLAAAALSARVLGLLVDDRGVIEIRAAVRVRLPIFADVFNPVGTGTVALARMRDNGGPGDPPPSPGDGPVSDPPNPPTPPNPPPPLPVPPRPRFVRPGAALDTLPGDAQLVAVSFEGVTIDRVRIDRPGVPASDTTYVVPNATNQLDLAAAIPLRTVETVHAAKTVEAADAGTMTLRYESGGVHFTLSVPLDLGEGTSLQRVAYLAADTANRREELMAHLQANRAYYTRAVLGSLDSAALVMLLSGFTWRGKPLADQVEPTPLAVAGNFLVLRAPVEDDELSGIGDNSATWGALVRQRALTSDQQDARLVPIPTGGVFAEAVLGRSNSAEKLDLTRFWNWQDSPIPLQPPEIAPVATGSRATAEDLRPGQLGAPVLNISSPTSLPEPAGLGAVLGAIASGNMFRDMSGLAGTQALAQAGAAGTLNAATQAGQLASANLKTVTDQAVAMGQAAADMWKTLHAPNGSGGSGSAGGSSGSRNTVSAEGARVNHGRDMDERGVTAPTPSQAMPLASPGGESPMSDSGGDVMPGVEGGFGSPPMTSRELAFSDIGAAGVSPPMMSDIVAALGGTLAKAPAKRKAMTTAQLLALLTPDLVNVGPTLGPTLGLSVADLKKIKLKTLSSHKHGKQFVPLYGAWTNSATEIFLEVAAILKLFADLQKLGFSDAEAETKMRALTMPALRHELQHVQQFLGAKPPGPPRTFDDMVKFEKDAYGESVRWIQSGDADTHLQATFKLAAQNLDISSELDDEEKQFQHAADFFTPLAQKIGKVSSTALRDEMALNGFLPKTLPGKGAKYLVQDLY